MASEEHKEPQVRVVDRRWWARENAGQTPGEDAGARKPTYVEELEQRLADSANQLQSYILEHRKSLDEFEQVKVRLRRDVAREVERGKRAVLAELLEVVDNLDRAIAAAPPSNGDDAGQLIRGVQLVRDQFLAKLQSFGVVRVPSLGQHFDASRHEAVTATPVDTAGQDGMVVSVIKEGYAMGDELLRPAAVVVGQFRVQSSAFGVRTRGQNTEP